MKIKQQNRKVNIMLSNGLYVISAKCRVGTPLYVLYLTDFAINTRVIFDADTLSVLPNKYGVEIAEGDKEALVKALGWEKKVKALVVVEPKNVGVEGAVLVKNDVPIFKVDNNVDLPF